MSKRTRRQFLEDSMFAAAAAAAAAGSTGALPAAEESTHISPNEKLGVAVMGVRGRGGSHLGAFAGRSDTEVVCVCDCDEEVGRKRASDTATRQGGRTPKFVADIRKALEDKSVDIVSIATPNHWHALASIWAIQAGKDVYVEKPVSHNVSEGRRVVEAARKHGRICQAGMQCRSNPGMIAAMKHVHDGEIGKVRVARGLCYKPRGSIGPRGKYDVPESVNYDLWLGPAPMAPLTRPRFHYDWHWQWPYGNGDLGNQGIHQMDLARWALGKNTLSNAVISYGWRYGYVDAGDTPNTLVVLHDYGDQALVFEVRGLKTGSHMGAKIGLIVEGAEGFVVMVSYSNGAAFDLKGKMITKFGGSGDHFGNFIKAVRSRKHTDLTGDIEEGHLSSALCHMGNVSYRLGRRVPAGEVLERLETLKSGENVKATLNRFTSHLKDNKIDPARDKIQLGANLAFDANKETFTDDAAAEMLSRDYRAPYVVPKADDV